MNKHFRHSLLFRICCNSDDVFRQSCCFHYCHKPMCRFRNVREQQYQPYKNIRTLLCNSRFSHLLPYKLPLLKHSYPSYVLTVHLRYNHKWCIFCNTVMLNSTTNWKQYAVHSQIRFHSSGIGSNVRLRPTWMSTHSEHSYSFG